MQETFKQGELILISDEDSNYAYAPRIFSHINKLGRVVTYTNVCDVDGNLAIQGKTSWEYAKKHKGEIHKDFINKQPKLLNFNFY